MATMKTLIALIALLSFGCATMKYEQQTDTERQATKAVDIIFDVLNDLDKLGIGK